MKSRNYTGFTLVELIVVITILAVLGTIGFLSYQGYTQSARESARISDIRVIEKGLSVFGITKSPLPTPDNAITITASGTVVGYQGDAGTGVLKAISQAELITDPLDGEFYSYFLNASKTQIQMLALMEKSESITLLDTQGVYAAPDYSKRYPKLFGRALGMLTYTDNTPLHQSGSLTNIDVVTYSGATNYTAHFTKDRTLTGTGDVLWEMSENANCNRIKDLTNTNSGIYTINPKGSGEIEVYCEMGIDDGGWTLIARTSAGATGGFGWLISTGSVADDASFYSLGDTSMSLGFDEIMLTTYSSEKNIDRALKITVDKSYIGDSNNHSYKRLTTDCTELYPTTAWRSACDGDGEDGKEGTRNFARSWGWAADSVGIPTTKFTFRNATHSAQFSTNNSTQLVNITDPSYGGITVDGYTQGDCANGSACSSFGEFGGQQGMIFVR